MKAGKLIKAYLKQIFQKFNVITGIVLVFLLGSVILYAGQLTNSLITFSEGNIASATQVNTNFQLLSNAVDRNREGFACEMNTPFVIDSSTDNPFICETMLADFAGYTGAYLFEASESGVYQIHRHILVSFAGTTYVDSSYNTLFLNGTSIDDNSREYHPLNPGDYIELKLTDTLGGGSSLEPGSMVFVKRIF
jgi:hypothetical protein